ncbi:hypothetical protein FsymDg_4465 [Candidatus Protofrankia datiscae]|uniref:Uncharacterized protein n=1 Tax=Candidatus Protofrankia datiscae TaxID=2716812 RepID=F8B017_9ACTN|nr:hypothetical protein FsymDg_4465 [Candidatus Protofrankia datiscae]
MPNPFPSLKAALPVVPYLIPVIMIFLDTAGITVRNRGGGSVAVRARVDRINLCG